MSSLGEEDTVLGSTLHALGVPRSHPAVRMAHASVMEGLFGERGASAPIGRYVPKKKLGAGANGVVFLATDEVLARDVAIKVLLGVDASTSAGSDAARRWTREAQVVARLSHPNIVEVFDVGVDGSRPWLAMELVDGGSLADWLAAEERSRAEILACFLQAGEGLAAAHRMGVIHRDFKPANVLVGRDGRVRVADFGLAGFLHEAATESADDPQPASVESAGSTRLTHTGSVMGTPVFMPPEQHRGDRLDARADQYAFCVSLWHALLGAMPFSADSIASLYHAKVSTPPGDSPAAKELPAALRAALRRGLSPDPAERFATMDDLLAAMRPRGSARRERWVWGVLGAVLVAFGGGVALLPGADGACDRAGTELEAVWDGDAKSRTVAALEAAGGGDLSARAESRIDAFVAAWSAARRETCEAMRDADATSADATMQCLREAEARLRSTVDLLSGVDAGGLPHVPELLHGLGDPRGCRLDAEVQDGPPRPQDPELAAVVDDLRARRAELAPLIQARRVGADDPRADEIVDAADASDYGPLRAEAHVMLGRLLSGEARWPEAVEQYETSYALAVEHAYDEVVFDSAIVLARVHAEALGLADDAERWISHAHAALQRLGEPLGSSARYEEARGVLARARGDVPASVMHYAAAVEAYERTLDVLPWQRATALHNYANALAAAGRLEESLHAREQALASLDEELGPEHPITGGVRFAYAADLHSAGRLGEAQLVLERVLEGFRVRLPPGHPWIVKVLNELGLVLRREGEGSLARERFSEALALARAGEGFERDVLVYGIGSNLAELSIALHDLSAAESLLREMIVLGGEVYGEDHPRVLMSEVRLARVLSRLGQSEDGEALARSALSRAQAGEAHDIAAHAQFDLAQIVVARDRDEARALANEALRYWNDPDELPDDGTPFADSAERNANLVSSWIDETLGS